MARLRLAVLISGRGSNLQALIDATADPAYPAQIVRVIANRADAAGLARATAAGIATRVIRHIDYPDRESFDEAIHRELEGAGAQLVCLAGFMRLLSAGFVQRWQDRLVNIHPSLLPAFKGRTPQADAIAAGVRFSGCTVHFVRPEMDSGPIIVQAVVPVGSGDDADSLAARILAAEHRCYPLAVKLIAESRVVVVDDRAIVDGARMPEGTVVNPAA